MTRLARAFAVSLVLPLAISVPTRLISQAPTADPDTEGVTLAPVTVTAQGPVGYAVPDATTALKGDAPLLTTPQAVSVIPIENIRDRGVRKIEEAVQNTAGVTPGGYYGSLDFFRIRGFDSSAVTYLDGLKVNTSADNAELWGLERVEVLKGPSATLYGGGSLGGLVNMVSKRPRLDTFFGELMVGGGSFDLFEAGLDLNIPLNGHAWSPAPAPVIAGGKDAKAVNIVTTQSEDGTLALRLNSHYVNGGLFQDHTDYERIYVSGALLWELGPDTSLTILSSYRYSDFSFPFPLPAHGTVLSNPNGEIPVTRFIGNYDGYNALQGYLATLGYEFKHAFNEHVNFRQNFRASWSELTRDNILYSNFLTEDQRFFAIGPVYNARDKYSTISVDSAVDFKFDTGPVAHTLTAGVDYNYYKNSYSDASGPFEEVQLFDLFRPRYDFVWSDSGAWNHSHDDYDALGFYLQERMVFFDKLTLLLGGRYDITTHDDHSIGESFEESAFTPRVGLSYEFVPGVAAYATYSRNFAPQWFSTDASGNPVEPEEAENWEAGIKTSLLDGRLTSSLAVYQLTRENVATSDMSTPDPFDSIVTGEQRVRGVEFENALQLLPGLDLTAAYTYMDGEITEDNTIPVGTRIQAVPDHSVSAWLKYTIQDGPLKGLGIGVGGRYYTSQAGDLYDTFSLPAYGVLDAALYYEKEDFRIQVNFNNITDKRYFVGSYDELYVLPGAPFNVSAQVSWKF